MSENRTRTKPPRPVDEMLLEGVERDVEGLEEVSLGGRRDGGPGDDGLPAPRLPVIVQHQLLVVGEGLPVAKKVRYKDD